MDRAKEQIRVLVAEYKKLFPGEYKQFLESNRLRIEGLDYNNDFAEIRGSQHVVRHLFEIPETLYHAFLRGLTDEELDWLYSRNQYEKDRKGLAWFIREFPEFKVTKDF